MRAAERVSKKFSGDFAAEFRGWCHVKTHRIALYPGDGIGGEVVASTVSVLDAVARASGRFALDLSLIHI